MKCFRCARRNQKKSLEFKHNLPFEKKGVQKISLCFDNNMINFDFKDKYILVSLSIGPIQ